MQSIHWPFLKRTVLITVWVRVIYPGHFLLWECAPWRRKTWFEKILTIIMIVMVWYPNPTGFSVSPWRHHDSTIIKSSIHCSHLFTTPPPSPPVCQVVPLPCMMSLQHVSPGWFACCRPSLFLFLLPASPLVTWALSFVFFSLLELRFWHFDKRKVFLLWPSWFLEVEDFFFVLDFCEKRNFWIWLFVRTGQNIFVVWTFSLSFGIEMVKHLCVLHLGPKYSRFNDLKYRQFFSSSVVFLTVFFQLI